MYLLKTVFILGVIASSCCIKPSLHGPGYDCEPAFPSEADNLSLDTLLLCNKTSQGPGFSKTEVQTLNTQVLKLQDGECDQFKNDGFRCIEHYKCIGDDVKLITHGDSQTRIVSIKTTVNVSQSSAGFSSTYGFSILDATDRTCRTYTKVCCGPNNNLVRSTTESTPISTTTITTTTESTPISTTTVTTTTQKRKCSDKVAPKKKVELQDLVLFDGGEDSEDCEPATKPPPVTPNKPCNLKVNVRKVSDLTDLVLFGSPKSDVDCDNAPEIDCKAWKDSLVAGAVELRDDCAEDRGLPTYSYIPKCGRHNKDGFQQSIVNMDQNLHESQFAEWPNMCAVLHPVTIRSTEIDVYQAGASLISPKFLLTAAHKLNGTNPVVRCGDWDTKNENELYSHETREVIKMYIHPDYDKLKQDFKNDIAILEVNKPFKLAPHIDTICLPPPKSVFDGKLCAATGWGKDRFGNQGKFQTILKEIWMTVLDSVTCEEQLRETRLGNFFELDTTSFICAGGKKDVDMCTGDGGSPLMCETGDGSFVQAGIVAVGIGCGDEVPGLYVNVASYVCWIKEIVERVEGPNYLPYDKECKKDIDDFHCTETFCTRENV